MKIYCDVFIVVHCYSAASMQAVYLQRDDYKSYYYSFLGYGKSCGKGIWRISKKKESRLTPTFVNLKSNTMKNTLQRYGLSGYLQIIQIKKDVL